jgi:hypothetical protein
VALWFGAVSGAWLAACGARSLLLERSSTFLSSFSTLHLRHVFIVVCPFRGLQTGETARRVYDSRAGHGVTLCGRTR